MDVWQQPLQEFADSQDWLDDGINSSDLYHIPGQQHNQQEGQAHIANCPECSQPVQLQFALNEARCSCGHIFCSRCKAPYLTSQEHVAVTAAAAADAHHLHSIGSDSSWSLQPVVTATCNCGAVDRAAVEARWGAAAVACWPAMGPQLQLVLLQLLQAHQESIVPLLSWQLLEQLHAKQQSSAPGLALDWGSVAGLAAAIQQQQQLQQLQQAADGSNEQDAPADEPVHLIPTSATPNFKLEGHNATTMDIDHAPSSTAAAAAAAAAFKSAVTAPDLSHVKLQQQKQQTAEMQVDEASLEQCSSSLLSQHHHHQQQQQQPLLVTLPQQRQQQPGADSIPDVPAPPPAAAELAGQIEEEELGALLQDAAAPDAAAATAAAREAHELLGPDVQLMAEDVHLQLYISVNDTSNDGSMMQQQQQRQQQRPAGQQLGSPDESEPYQLVLDDFVEQPELMQEDLPAQQQHSELATSDAQQQQQPKGSSAEAGAVLHGRGDRLIQVELDNLAGSAEGGKVVAAAPVAAEAVPQLSDFGLKEEAPPQLPDEPVVLLSTHEDDSRQQLFWTN